MNNLNPFVDELGIIHALVMHMEAGHDCDELKDEAIFTPFVEHIQALMEIVIDENFGGDVKAFHIMMLRKIAESTFTGEDPLTALVNWLKDGWEASGKLYN